MSKKITWGVLSTANIAVKKVIPAMQLGTYSEIKAIASRNLENAIEIAKDLNIGTAYGSYDELLNDPTIEAVYIPLPNHLHVEWILKALKAGKHVLCEKPIGLNAKQAKQLLEQTQQYPKLKVMEGFMYRFHPRWNVVKEHIKKGTIGDLKNIHSTFTYYNVDPTNIRNKPEVGGGSLLDVGCYCVSLSRFLFEEEPIKVLANINYDPVLKTDYLVSAILQFPKGTATFTCSTQLLKREYAEIIGTEGAIEIPHSFIPSKDDESKIVIANTSEHKEIVFKKCNQYTLQGDAFSLAILNNTEVPTSLQDALDNMIVIDQLFKSGKEQKWIEINH
ncbi:putative dehydrogenase [Wenyingzhuangia heitensis]|uniref:Dehydrogenase n=1 Tax=Wenyingzhuangia heitensis TaxID=1487859 RepID=A0ABX0U769_9FLAO|nr:Gfo/Idh/MocA family oxidoreductase [Wenyingzhuangia heitensis]NIJ44184.1 putative dehydrogenase [Wenyingzhuangia heitensis]